MKEYIAEEKVKHIQKFKTAKSTEARRKLTLLYKDRVCGDNEDQKCLVKDLRAEQ